MGLFSSLYRYKQSSLRSPLEDFLTEALCYLLKKIEENNLTSEALIDFFGIDDWHEARIQWETQYVIRASDTTADRKRPDLVGSGKANGRGAFVIIENKIWASQTAHEDSLNNEYVEQLQLYQDYLSKNRAEDNKQLRLLTYGTPPPSTLCKNSVVYWYQLANKLEQWSKKDGMPEIVSILCQELQVFLVENGMANINLTLVEISSMGPWNALQKAYEALGGHVASSVWSSNSGSKKIEAAGFGNPGGNSRGQLRENNGNFSGVALTPGCKNLDNSECFFWMGVLVKPVYEFLVPRSKDIPELSIGFGIWVNKINYEAVRDKVRGVCSNLNKGANGKYGKWLAPSFERDPNDQEKSVVLLEKKYTFLQLYESPDWNNEARIFYDESLREISSLDIDDLKFIASWADRQP